MKKFRLIIASLIMVGGAAYLAYQIYFPILVAKSFESETSDLLPEDVQERIEKVKLPVNEGAELIITKVHQSENTTIDDVLGAIDNATEVQALSFLDEMNKTEIVSADQVFSMAKKHFPTNFDVEIFRKPFEEKMTVPLIKKCIKYANIYRVRQEIDAETAKSIIKRILLQKEEEFNRLLSKRN